MNLFRKWLPAAQLCCLVLVLALTGCAKDVVDTTGSIYGIVNDADNGEPVSGAHISLNPGGLTANTGSDGRFEFGSVEPGQYTVQVSKSGYKTNSKRINVVAGQQASGDMVLERGEARIRLNTQSLTFAPEESSKTFEVMNVGSSGDVSWSIQKTDAWISVNPASGTTGQGKNSAVVVTVDRTQITEDVSTNLLVEGDGESMSLAVSVQAGEPQEPDGDGDEENPDKGSDKYQFYIVTGRRYDDQMLSGIESSQYDKKVTSVYESYIDANDSVIRANRKAWGRDGLRDFLDSLSYKAKEYVAANPPAKFTEAQSEAYRIYGGAPYLDGDYTVFGEVVEGMDVVEKIEKVRTDAGDRPLQIIRVKKATILE